MAAPVPGSLRVLRAASHYGPRSRVCQNSCNLIGGSMFIPLVPRAVLQKPQIFGDFFLRTLSVDIGHTIYSL